MRQFLFVLTLAAVATTGLMADKCSGPVTVGQPQQQQPDQPKDQGDQPKQ